MLGPPRVTPIGLKLATTAKIVSRAFDDVLAAAGGSRPVWLILISLKARPVSNQRELAAVIGIQGATVTHHLNAMEADGLVTRERDLANRRVHVLTLTKKGQATFERLRGAAAAFDRRLRAGIPDADLARLAELLDRLVINADEVVVRDQI
jgi:MarR family transcriptional regulator, transcriptional regulator for hemolysin